jgi:hypothetical protein
MALIYPHLVELALSGRDVIVCGDWNIAHQEIDLRNWRGNRKNSGFLPEERAWVSRLLNEGGWCDVYRRLHPEATEEAYTWWSNRGQAWAKNVGWRLDYQLATATISGQAKSATVYKDERFSDHAPLTIDYDICCERWTPRNRLRRHCPGSRRHAPWRSPLFPTGIDLRVRFIYSRCSLKLALSPSLFHLDFSHHLPLRGPPCLKLPIFPLPANKNSSPT